MDMKTHCHTSYCLGLIIVLFATLFRLEAQNPTSPPPAIIDTLVEVEIEEIYVFARHHQKVRPLTLEERRQLWRRIRDVKKVYPYAKYVAATIIETYEYMQTLPEKEQEPHLKRVEKELKKEMEPKMRDLTLNQGSLLIKLINRQCGMTGYQLIQSFLGGFRAWTWQIFARIMGANLKSIYNPLEDPDDALTERIIRLHELQRL